MSSSDDDIVAARPRLAAAPPPPARASPPSSDADDPAAGATLGALTARLARASLAPAAAAAAGAADGWALSPAAARLPGGFAVPRALWDRLFGYQREGIAWMWSLHADSPAAAGALGRATERATAGAGGGGAAGATGAAAAAGGAVEGALAAVARGADKISGGILADDMGLGKTAQTATFLAGLLGARGGGGDNGDDDGDDGGARAAAPPRCALVVLPVSLLATWRAEFAKFAPRVRVDSLHEQSGLAARARAVRRAARGGGVLLTTYGLVTATPALFGAPAARGDAAAEAAAAALGCAGLAWDALVLDEGHRVKNPATASARAVRALPARFRLLLSGTPIQNNLDELWALFDIVAQGRLLDSRAVFNRSLGDRIAAARDRRATPAQRADGAAATATLMAIVSPHLLRREKDKLLALGGEGGGEEGAAAAAGGAAGGAGGGGAAGALPAARAPTSLEALAPSAAAATGARAGTAMGLMGEKKEVVLWVPLAPAQRALYVGYLALAAAARAAAGGGDEAVEAAAGGGARRAAAGASDFVLAAIMNLRKLATHPILLTRAKLAAALRAAEGEAAAGGGGADAALAPDAAPWLHARAAAHEAAAADARYDSNGEERAPGGAPPPPPPEPAWAAADLPSADALVAASGKLGALVLLLRQAARDGAKTLVFSQHTRSLDVVEKVLARLYTLRAVAGLDGPGDGPAPAFARGADGRGAPKTVRVDGTLKAAERAAAVAAFNADAAVSIALLSTGVGALGLTLTAATRVVLLDVSWNPAVDAQAVDRAYRVGQTRDVVTYRLISAGTVEEKMYRLQVFKGGLTSSVMGARGGRGGGGAAAAAAGGDAGAAAAAAALPAASAMRFLSSTDIKGLFELGATEHSETQRLIAAVIAPPPVASRETREHLLALAAPPHARASVGLSHHDGLFNLLPEDVTALQEQLAEERAAARARGEAAAATRRRRARRARAAEGSDGGSDGGDGRGPAPARAPRRGAARAAVISDDSDDAPPALGAHGGGADDADAGGDCDAGDDDNDTGDNDTGDNDVGGGYESDAAGAAEENEAPAPGKRAGAGAAGGAAAPPRASPGGAAADGDALTAAELAELEELRALGDL